MIRALADLFAAVLIALTSLTGNIGWSLVILTILVRLVLHPLTSLRSLRRTRAVTPQVEALRRTYSRDPQRTREEIFRLYRNNGINPWAALLPTVVQIPILVAFFQILVRGRLFADQIFFGIPLDAIPCPGSRFSRCSPSPSS